MRAQSHKCSAHDLLEYDLIMPATSVTVMAVLTFDHVYIII